MNYWIRMCSINYCRFFLFVWFVHQILSTTLVETNERKCASNNVCPNEVVIIALSLLVFKMKIVLHLITNVAQCQCTTSNRLQAQIYTYIILIIELVVRTQSDPYPNAFLFVFIHTLRQCHNNHFYGSVPLN